MRVVCLSPAARAPFEDLDLAVGQFVFPTGGRRLWHALDENDERSLTRPVNRFDRTAASYVDAFDRAGEKRGSHEQALLRRGFAERARRRRRRKRPSPLDCEDDRPYGRSGIPFPEGVSDVSETCAVALARDGGGRLCFVRRAGRRVVCAYPAAQQRRTEAVARARSATARSAVARSRPAACSPPTSAAARCEPLRWRTAQ